VPQAKNSVFTPGAENGITDAAENKSFIQPTGTGKMLDDFEKALSSGTGNTSRNTENLIDSAKVTVKGNNTAVGRAFQKHSVREITSFTGDITGNAAKNTEQGINYINKILSDPNTTFTIRHTMAYGDVLDARLPNGMRARWTVDGKKFIGLLER
jgi:hypothetical protein